jgi:hypothetical protein
MTYTVTFVVLRNGKKSTLSASFAGCLDAEHAEYKLRGVYTDVLKVTKIEEKKK